MNKTLKKFLKVVIALILTISIFYIGYFCCEQFIITEQKGINVVLYFLGSYFIVIKPVSNYWSDIITKIITLNHEN